MRIRTAASLLGCGFALTGLTATPALASVVRPDSPLTLQSSSGCSPLGGSEVYCQVYPTGGTGTYWACWNGTCGSYEHLYFTEGCTPNSSVTVYVVVHSGQESVAATYSSECLGGPFLP